MPDIHSGSPGGVPEGQGRANPEGDIDKRELARELQNTIAAIRIEAPFFAHIITGARLKFRPLPDGFAAVSRGKRTIVVDPDKFRSMKPGPRVTTLLHEGVHLFLLHGLRGRSKKDKGRWQCAADVVVNSLLHSAGLLFTPPAPKYTSEWVASLGVQIPEEKLRKMSAEELYEVMPPLPSVEIPCCLCLDDDDTEDEEEGNEAESSGRGEELADPEQYWRQRVAAAAVMAKQAGKLPAGLDWIVREYLKVRTPWWAILQGVFTSGYSSSRTSWRRVSRRYGPAYPGTIWRGPSTLALVDCSGSITRDQQGSFVGHMNRIVRDTMGELNYLCWDAASYKLTPYRRGTPVKFEGGGGTTIAPVLKAAVKLSTRFECLVILTDFYISDAEDPEVKSLFQSLVYKYAITVLASVGAQARLPPGWKVLDISNTSTEALR